MFQVHFKLLGMCISKGYKLCLHSCSQRNLYCNFLVHRYSGDVPFDHQYVLKQSTPTTPVLIMYTREKDAGEKTLHEFARKKQQGYKTIMLSGSGPAEDRQARKTIQECMAEVKWYQPLHWVQLPDKPHLFELSVQKSISFPTVLFKPFGSWCRTWYWSV